MEFKYLIGEKAGFSAVNICALTPGRELTRSPVVNRARHKNLTTVLH